MDPGLQKSMEEAEKVVIPANCLFKPRKLGDLCCYYVFILFSTMFLWVTAIYFVSDAKTQYEEDLGRDIGIAAIVISGGLLFIVTVLYLMNCGKSKYELDDEMSRK